MNREETIKTFTNHLKKQEAFSFVKIGDDCVFCMEGRKGSNAELHTYTPKLREHMKETDAFLRDKQNVYMAKWGQERSPDMVFFDALLLHEDEYLTPNLKEFYQILKEDPRPKYYFARDRMAEAAKVFNMNFIPVPFPNSYDHVDDVIEKVKEIAKPGVVILFSTGMLSKIMVYECYKICPGMTAIDLGSAFDPFFIGTTRSKDESQHIRVREYYRDILQG